MRKLFLLLLLMTGLAFGQGGITLPGRVDYVAVAPTVGAACLNNASIQRSLQAGATNGRLYSCQGGLWAAITGAGNVVLGGSNLTTAGAIPYVSASGILSQDATNFFWDVTHTRLGIGTNSPQEIVHVVGNTIRLDAPVGQNTAAFSMKSGTLQSWSFESTPSGAGSFFQIVDDTASKVPFLIGPGAASNSLVIDPFGDVGIGTASPGAKLDLGVGSLKLSAYGAGTLTTDASGNVTAVSDERLKNIQRPFTRGLSQIAQLKPIVYKWRKGSGLETAHEYAGFSAQNVKQFIPEAIGQDSKGHLSLQDRPIEAALVNSIQELSMQVIILQKRVSDLEQRNNK